MQLDNSANSRRPTWQALLFVSLGIALLAQIRLVHFPPLLDYPNHLATTFVLKNLNNPHFRFHEYYDAEWRLYPNLTTELIMMFLQGIFPSA